MDLKIGICDDDKSIIHQLTEILWRYQMATDHNFKISHYSNGLDLLSAYTEPHTYHILFLDVEMPEKNGIDTAREIRRLKDRAVNIVFVSHYPKYMQESFSVHPFYYIQKPLSENMIFELMGDIISEIQEQYVIYTLVDTMDAETTINIKDVLYINVQNSKAQTICFHLKDHAVNAKGTISHWKNALEDYGFLLCQRDILVNLSAIHYFSGNSIILHNGEHLPISRGNRKKIRDMYLNRIIAHKNI